MLSITFIIPTYNAGKHIERCLKSLREQQYPQDKVEILIVEGGSSDNTPNIAAKYGCKILANPRRLAEYGVQIGMKAASSDLVVTFAADNGLVGQDWISKVVRIFEQYDHLSAVWGRLAAGVDDSALNKYFELIQSDPLNWFLNTNLRKYLRHSRYSMEHGCYFFKVDPSSPLVWGANGLVFRTAKIAGIWAQEGYLGDNDAFQYMIERGDNEVAYFATAFVYHHHVARISDWIRKWRRNFQHHLVDKAGTRNMNWVFRRNFKLKLLLWSFYSGCPVFSALHAIWLAVRQRNIYWLYHPVVSFAQLATYAAIGLSNGKAFDFMRRRL